MFISKRVRKYAAENFGEVRHTTLNPEGPGVVRIHLIPPKYEGKKGEEPGKSVAIINGQDIIPVNFAWSILLCEFIGEVNKYRGRPLGDAETDKIVAATIRDVRRVFPLLPKKRVTEDIWRIMNAFRQVAARQPVDEAVGYMSIGEYAP